MQDNGRTFLRLTIIGPDGAVWFDMLDALFGNQASRTLEAELDRVGVQRYLRDSIADETLKLFSRWKRVHRRKLAWPLMTAMGRKRTTRLMAGMGRKRTLGELREKERYVAAEQRQTDNSESQLRSC